MPGTLPPEALHVQEEIVGAAALEGRIVSLHCKKRRRHDPERLLALGAKTGPLQEPRHLLEARGVWLLHELLHDEAAREVRGHRAVVAMGLYAAATKAAQSTHKKKTTTAAAQSASISETRVCTCTPLISTLRAHEYAQFAFSLRRHPCQNQVFLGSPP